MNKLLPLAAIALIAALNSAPVQAQEELPDCPSQTAGASGGIPPDERATSWRALPHDFLVDQKAIWLFPTLLIKGHHLVPTLAIVGTTAGLIAADPHIASYFRNHQGPLDDTNDVFDPLTTTAEIIVLPASLLVSGYIRHDSYQVSTSLLAAEAYADSAVVDLAMKAITRRERPSDIPPGEPLTDTFFSSSKSPFKGGSFPSGHAAGAFAVATVVARRYHSNRWVPWMAYGFATAISFSRVTSSAHFPSDVFLGAALGYSIARFQVLRPR